MRIKHSCIEFKVDTETIKLRNVIDRPGTNMKIIDVTSTSNKVLQDISKYWKSLTT